MIYRSFAAAPGARVVALATAALAFAGMAHGEPVPLATPFSDAQAAKVVSSCARAKPMTGTDAMGTFRACFLGGELALIEDRPGAPPGAASPAPARRAPTRYFYDHGALRYARSDSAARTTGGGPTADAPTVAVVIEWAATGEVRRAVRLEHYGEVRLTDTVVGEARTRGLALAATARAARPAP